MEILRHKPTPEEKRLGLESSINSEGLVGKINRELHRVTRFASDFFGDEVDIVAFIRNFKNFGRPDF